MPAFELMERMTVAEMQYWTAYDQLYIDKRTYQFAAIMAKLDWIKGVKRPDARRYLPRVKRKKRSLAQLRANMFWAAAASGGLKPKEGSDGR
jgi:hypothetical protein